MKVASTAAIGVLGAMVGSIATTWRSKSLGVEWEKMKKRQKIGGLSLRMNVMGWLLDRSHILYIPDDWTQREYSESEIQSYVVGMREVGELSGTVTRVLRGGSEPVASSEDTTFLNRDGIQIPVRITRPLNSKPDQNLPVVLYFHGGGFVTGSYSLYDGVNRAFSNSLNCVVVTPNYRLAPETRFPGAHHDCIDTLHWIIKAHEQLKIDPNRIILAGDSAGGNLAVAVAVVAAAEKIQIRLQILIYPMTTFVQDVLDLDPNGDGLLPPGKYKRNTPSMSWIQNAGGPFLRSLDIFWCGSLYVTNDADAQNPMATTLFTPLESLRNVAPCLLATASHDPLRDDGVALAIRLKKAGAKVVHLSLDGKFHGFINDDKGYHPEFYNVVQSVVSGHLGAENGHSKL